MDLSFDDIFELDCVWLYLTPFFMLLTFGSWCSSIYYFKHDTSSFAAMFVLYLLMIIGESICYFYTLKHQPMQDWNFWISRFLSLIIFYSNFFILFGSLILLFKNAFTSLPFLNTFKTIIICYWFIQFSFGLAYSSPFGMIYSLISLILTIIKIFIIPSRPITSKRKISSESSSSDESDNEVKDSNKSQASTEETQKEKTD